MAKSGEVEQVEGWALRLAKAVKEDSVVILLDSCAVLPDHTLQASEHHWKMPQDGLVRGLNSVCECIHLIAVAGPTWSILAEIEGVEYGPLPAI